MAVEQLTISEVAARFGVSVDTVRRRVRRGLLRARRDNHGQWWVELDSEVPSLLVSSPPPADVRLAPALLPMQPPALVPAYAAATPLPPSYLPELAEVREQLAAARGELTGMREALRVAEAGAREAAQRADRAEATALEAWRTTATLARRLAADEVAQVSAQPAPTSPRSRRGWLARLLG